MSRTTEDDDRIEREYGDEWRHDGMGVKAQEMTLRRGDNERRQVVVSRKETQRYGSLVGGDPEPRERWAEITTLSEQEATEVMFALAEAHGYELEER